MGDILCDGYYSWSNFFLRFDEDSEIDTWELDAATNIKAGNLPCILHTKTETIYLNWLQISGLRLLH